jgi:heavy metal translocating P-type ATPase
MAITHDSDQASPLSPASYDAPGGDPPTGTPSGSRLQRVVATIRRFPVPFITLFLLTMAGVLALVGYLPAAQWALIAIILLGGIPLLWETLTQIVKGEFGVDLIALLAISGSLLLGEYLAGAIIVLMLSGGTALEAYALRRARSSLSALAERAPREAHIRHDDTLETVPADAIQPGDEVVVRQGELVPVDGVVTAGSASVSEADLTGEPLPVHKEPGALVLSGSVSLDGVLDIRARRRSAESQYAQIVRLVEAAQQQKAPIHRLADRYAVWFTIITLAIAGIAWVTSGNSVYALAVLVVATPCPLILATPIAIMSGIDRAARSGVILKSGAAMEQLGEVDIAVFDKTGTLTLGRPELVDIIPLERLDTATGSRQLISIPAQSLLEMAASVEQFSPHILARAVVSAAQAQGLPLLPVTDLHEVAGKGMSGMVMLPNGEGHAVEGLTRPMRLAIGNRTYMRYLDISLPPGLTQERERRSATGQIASFLALEKQVVALMVFADIPRPQLGELGPSLHASGLKEVVLLTGDGPAAAEAVGRLAGVDRVVAQCLPDEKVRVVAEAQSQGRQVLMVGDGVNDAPALALATVGLALGSQGLTASTGIADAVMLSPDILQVVRVVRLGRHVMRVAKQGIWVGIGLSLVAMIAAAMGYIPPVAGAILQEGVDVLVILNALRAGRQPPALPAVVSQRAQGSSEAADEISAVRAH